MIIGRHIQEIVTCFDIFSSHNHIKNGSRFGFGGLRSFPSDGAWAVPAAVRCEQKK